MLCFTSVYNTYIQTILIYGANTTLLSHSFEYVWLMSKDKYQNLHTSVFSLKKTR